MNTYSVTFYDYWQRRKDQTATVQAKSANEAKVLVMKANPEIGTAIVFVKVKQL